MYLQIEELFLFGCVPLALFLSSTFSTVYHQMHKRSLSRNFVSLPTYKSHIFKFIHWFIFSKAQKIVPSNCHVFRKINAICKQFEKEGLVFMQSIFRRWLFVFKADIVKLLLNHPAVQEKSKEYEPFKSLVGEGLFSLNSQKAQKHRKLIIPSFHMGILKDYTTVFNEQSIAMVNKLKVKSHESWINVDSYVKNCTLQVICQCTMGLQTDSNEDMKQFTEALDTALGIVAYRIFRPWTHCDAIHQFFPIGRKFKKSVRTIKRVISKIILESKKGLTAEEESTKSEECEEETQNGNEIYTRRKTFIKLLLEAHLKEPSFTLEDLRDEVLTFIGAGAETLTITVNIILMMLGLYQDVQQTAVEEIDAIFQDDRKRFVTYEDVSEMKFLDCVIKETLRIYPSAPLVGREIKEDIYLGKYLLPKHTGLYINIHLLHRDPEYFPNPEKFDPARFFPENIHHRHPYAYMPFSAGVRNCIGQKFAMVQMKVIISLLLRNFRIQSLDERDTLNFSYQISVKNVKPIRLKLIPKSNQCTI